MVNYIQTKLLADQFMQKEYGDRKIKDVDFKVGEQVLLQVYSIKGVMMFDKRWMISPWYIGPFESLNNAGLIIY